MAGSIGNMSIGDVVELVFEGDHDGQTILSTFHYLVQEIQPTPTQIETAFGVMHASLIGGAFPLLSAFRDCVSVDYSLNYVRYQIVQPNRLPFIRFPHAVNGLVDGACLPAANTVSLERRGAGTTRRNIGRLQMPAVPTAWVADSQTNALAEEPYGNMALACALAWDDAFGEGSLLLPCLIKQVTVGPAPPPILIWTGSAKTEIRTMSRRVVGRGI